MTVPPYFDRAGTALSGGACSTIMNGAEVPGLTWSRTHPETPCHSLLAHVAEQRAETRAQRKAGERDKEPEHKPPEPAHAAPPPVDAPPWAVVTWYLPSRSREMAATLNRADLGAEATADHGGHRLRRALKPSTRRGSANRMFPGRAGDYDGDRIPMTPRRTIKDHPIRRSCM